MVSMEAMLVVVCQISWFHVCPYGLFFVLACDINVFDRYLCRAGRQEVNMVLENCIVVIIKSPEKLDGITIQLSREIRFSIISGLILVPLDVSKRRW